MNTLLVGLASAIVAMIIYSIVVRRFYAQSDVQQFFQLKATRRTRYYGGGCIATDEPAGFRRELILALGQFYEFSTFEAFDETDPEKPAVLIIETPGLLPWITHRNLLTIKLMLAQSWQAHINIEPMIPWARWSFGRCRKIMRKIRNRIERI